MSRLVSIVIPTVDPGGDRVRWCLASLKTCTPEPHEIIISADYKRTGFAATVNRGIVQARGNFLLLLNDDVTVGPGWLSRMLSVFDAFPDVGLVGPCSNNVSGPQQRESLPGPISQEVGRLVGFCLLVRREVIGKIGCLDEAYGLTFEDDDLCLRARAAGFKARIALDSFVHHDCSATFREGNIDFAASMAQGWAVFSQKWGAKRTATGYTVDTPIFSNESCYCPLSDLMEVEHVAV